MNCSSAQENIPLAWAELQEEDQSVVWSTSSLLRTAGVSCMTARQPSEESSFSKVIWQPGAWWSASGLVVNLQDIQPSPGFIVWEIKLIWDTWGVGCMSNGGGIRGKGFVLQCGCVSAKAGNHVGQVCCWPHPDGCSLSSPIWLQFHNTNTQRTTSCLTPSGLEQHFHL